MKRTKTPLEPTKHTQSLQCVEKSNEVDRIGIKSHGINVLSLFDGMSCTQIALNRAKIKVNKYFASEIDKYAIKVTQANYPNTIQLGDISKIKGDDLPRIDLLVGGSPCQSFSFAGKQLNFNDKRGQLFFEYVRLLKEVKPLYFLLENVKMKKEYQDIISGLLGVEPIEINSSLVSAQNRKRLYWTNIPNITQPEDKGIMLKDILENEVDEKYYYKEKSLAYMKKGNEKWMQAGLCRMDRYTMTEGKKSFCLTANFCKGVPYNFLIEKDSKPRKLTPIECERLQTVDDNFTNHVSNSQRYKMLGNGFTVDVITHILKEINQCGK